MDKARRLKITDVQIENGKREEVEMTTLCTFSGTEDDYSIDFDEIFAEDMKSHTTLKMKDGRCATLLRQGSVNTEMIIEKGKRHNSVYSTPYGDIIMGIEASDIESEFIDNRIKIKLCYSIDYSGSVAQTKEMKLEVSTIDNKARKDEEE